MEAELKWDPDIDATGCAYALPERSHWIERVWYSMHAPAADGPVNYINSGNLVCRRDAFDAIAGGDLARGIELTTPEIAEKLSFAGTPEEVTAKIKEIEPAGVNHLIAAITDASLVKAFTGRALDGVATVDEQLRLLHDEVMPSFR